MKCPQCGRELPYGSTYCLFCDSKITFNETVHRVDDTTRAIPKVTRQPGSHGDEYEERDIRSFRRPSELEQYDNYSAERQSAQARGNGRAQTRQQGGQSRKSTGGGKKPGGKNQPAKLDNKKIMLTAGVAVIIVIMLVFIVMLIRSCATSRKNNAGFGSGFNDGNAVDLPSYNQATGSRAPAERPNSQTPSSSKASSAASQNSSSDSTSSNPSGAAAPAVKPAAEYISSNYGALVAAFGEPTVDESSGAFQFTGCAYLFSFDSDGETPAASDPVLSVIVPSGGEVIPGVRVGQTYNQITDKIDGVNIDRNNDDVWVATLHYNNCVITFYIDAGDNTDDEPPKTAKTTAALIQVG